MTNQERIEAFKKKYGRFPNLAFIHPQDRELFKSFKDDLEVREYKFIEKGTIVLTIRELLDL